MAVLFREYFFSHAIIMLEDILNNLPIALLQCTQSISIFSFKKKASPSSAYFFFPGYSRQMAGRWKFVKLVALLFPSCSFGFGTKSALENHIFVLLPMWGIENIDAAFENQISPFFFFPSLKVIVSEVLTG